MGRLEEQLDIEVNNYIQKVEGMDEVRQLLSGEIDRTTYTRFLKAFYTIEYLSQRAVNMASIRTEDKHLYLSKRFHICAQGELGHAEIALKDLRDMGVEFDSLGNSPLVDEYDKLLQKEADNFPFSILGHSYLFENVSGKMFPRNKQLGFPSKFVEVHAKEDPGHSRAIRRTVRNIEKELTEEETDKIVDFTRKSGDYFMKVFEQY